MGSAASNGLLQFASILDALAKIMGSQNQPKRHACGKETHLKEGRAVGFEGRDGGQRIGVSVVRTHWIHI